MEKDYIYCAKCGEKLETSSMFCSNCGTKVVKENKQSNSKQKKKSLKLKHFLLPVIIILFMAGIALCVCVIFDSDLTGNIEFPVDSKNCTTYKCENLKTLLTNSGFTNVQVEKVCDLENEEVEMNEMVDSIVVEGQNAVSKGDKVHKDTEIVIKYHSYKVYDVNISIKCIKNYVFSTYDVDFYVDDIFQETIDHGTSTKVKLNLTKGNHTLRFESTEDSSLIGEQIIEIKGKTNAGYTIYCTSEGIQIDSSYIEHLSSIKENEIMMKKGASSYKDINYKEVKKELKKLGFTNIKTKIEYDIYWGITEEGSTESVSISGKKNFKRGDIFDKDAKVIITYHMKSKDDPNNQTEDDEEEDDDFVPSNTNQPYKQAINGNSGIFAYKKYSNSYTQYYIINFEDGYVYYFIDNENWCDKIKIDNGTLNDHVQITYNDGASQWKYRLHFNYHSNISTLIVADQNGAETKYNSTSLSEAQSIMKGKPVTER